MVTGHWTRDHGGWTMDYSDFVVGVTLSKLATKQQHVISAIGRVQLWLRPLPTGQQMPSPQKEVLLILRVHLMEYYKSLKLCVRGIADILCLLDLKLKRNIII